MTSDDRGGPEGLPRYGRIVMSPTGVLTAGARVTMTFTYTVGSSGIRQGGSLRLSTPNDDWEMPLAPMRRYFERGRERGGYDNGLCSYGRRNLAATCESADAGVWIDLDAQECMASPKLAPGTPWARHIIATVRGGDLAPGDRIVVVYGDREWGADGIRIQRVAPTPRDRFRAFVDPTGERDFEVVTEGNLEDLRVLPGPVTQFMVTVPAIVRPGEAFALRLAGVDAFRNLPEGAFTGASRLGCDQAGVAMPGEVRLAAADGSRAVVHGITVRECGVVRLHAEPADGRGSRSHSNPVWVTTQKLNLYVGDLHCQSLYHSDSLGTPAEGYAYGRDVAGLDFMGITDSGGWRSRGWEETQLATREAYEPGRFVTFKGFEYGATQGHRNVIYRDDAIEPVLEDLPPNDPASLFARFRGRDVIIIPHHTKVWTDWDFHDPELEPLAEAYSCWGSGVERDDPLWSKSIRPGSGLFNALARGYRFGVIGSGDSHSGMPGRSYPADRQWCVGAKSGLACVYAPELTREAVFDALRARRCYATTGARMILEFRVNGVTMGGEASLEDAHAERRLAIHVIGTDDLALLRIIKNNATLVRRDLDGDEVFFEHVDTTAAADGDWYMVRIEQRDGNTAWSSPVWVRV